MSTTTEPQNTPGLIISTTEPIRSFLLSASKQPHLSQNLRALASTLLTQNNIHYKSLRSLWIACQPSNRPDLASLFSGSEFLFTSPKPREKSEALKARLRKLEELAERNAYQKLVMDITPRNDETEPFSSYKDQLGFGLHVALTMFTGYLVGYATFRALFGHNLGMSAAGGILGLVCGMLVETLLFIIRTSNQDRRSSTSTLKKNQ
ncbi:hypothetical protein JCGZ_03630 [Jatropha curcas]|uniref:ATPase, vacuolar ER assembly factor, Vma12 n=2 Tax=Jatropha curcas TaxID=180498 RepID=A0A067LAK8_JATCU|nr:hypothetical protein JCGZ_03630 [Jatropha curcas]